VGRCETYDAALRAFIFGLNGAAMPRFLFSMVSAEPSAADTTVECCGSVASLVDRRHGLTGPFDAVGFGLFFLLQHDPSSWRAGSPSTDPAHQLSRVHNGIVSTSGITAEPTGEVKVQKVLETIDRLVEKAGTS
jgi:hypothetical protein